MKGQDTNSFADMEIDSWAGLVQAFSEQKGTWRSIVGNDRTGNWRVLWNELWKIGISTFKMALR